MGSGKTPRMEELKSGQQKMQEKIAQMTKMVTSLIKGKGLLMIPVYKKGLHPEKVAQIHLLSQIRTTFVNKED